MKDLQLLYNVIHQENIIYQELIIYLVTNCTSKNTRSKIYTVNGMMKKICNS